VLVNALSPPAFRGETTRYSRPGRIPTSVNVPARDLLDPDGRLRSAPGVEARLQAGGALDGRPVIAYCGAGISAALVAFALTRAGRDDVALYDGSLAEWSADPRLPLEVGPPAATSP
jgi:thiosulfate/3-mercaptopyruvate sulfurtransferase